MKFIQQRTKSDYMCAYPVRLLYYKPGGFNSVA
jgi:hypothetical protein